MIIQGDSMPDIEYYANKTTSITPIGTHIIGDPNAFNTQQN